MKVLLPGWEGERQEDRLEERNTKRRVQLPRMPWSHLRRRDREEAAPRLYSPRTGPGIDTHPRRAGVERDPWGLPFSVLSFSAVSMEVQATSKKKPGEYE